jgi:hypothetical protein
MVVNVHTNGPQVYAHEIYTLRHAVPGTSGDPECLPDEPRLHGHAARLPHGNARDQRARERASRREFTPEDVTGFRGMTFSLSWTVTGPATYVTGCTVVVLDQ